MERDKNIQTELSEMGASRLARWQGKAEEWSAPAGYFDQLADQVLQRAAEEPEAKVVTLRSRLRPILRMAAAVLLVAAAAWWVFQEEAGPEMDPFAIVDLESLSQEAIEGYVLANIDEFELEMLEELAQQEGLNITPAAGAEEWLEDEWSIDEDWPAGDALDLF